MMDFNDYPEYLTLAQVREILQISKNLALHLIHSGELVATRVAYKNWRVRKSDLIQYMENNQNC